MERWKKLFRPGDDLPDTVFGLVFISGYNINKVAEQTNATTVILKKC